MGQFIDLAGRTFGRWTALSHSNKKWTCRCACGMEKAVDSSSLRDGRSTSCGCFSAEQLALRNLTMKRSIGNLKHGLAHSREHETWVNIKARCNDPNNPRYGGRGIAVCDRWRQSFEAFYADMGPRPQGTSIDRFPDRDGPYSPENCRWATRSQQAQNKDSARFIQFGGHNLCLTDWAKRLEITQSSLRRRLRRLPLDQALTQQKAS